MIFTALYFAWRKQFDRHRRLTRVTLPIWLYVSVTGVLVFLMLRWSGA
jgi:putative membrane protein